MMRNEHVYAIYCRSEVDCDVISGQNVEALKGYVVVKLDVTNSSVMRNAYAGVSHNSGQSGSRGQHMPSSIANRLKRLLQNGARWTYGVRIEVKQNYESRYFDHFPSSAPFTTPQNEGSNLGRKIIKLL